MNDIWWYSLVAVNQSIVKIYTMVKEKCMLLNDMQNNSGDGTVLLWSTRHDSYVCYELPELDSRGDICHLLHPQVCSTACTI